METEKIIAELIKAHTLGEKQDILIREYIGNINLHEFCESYKITYQDFETDGETSCLMLSFGQFLLDNFFGPLSKYKEFLTLIFNYNLLDGANKLPLEIIFHISAYDIDKQSILISKLKKEFFGNANIGEEFDKHILADNVMLEANGYKFDADIHTMIIEGTLKLKEYADGSKQLFDVEHEIYYSKDYLPLMPTVYYELHKEKLIRKQ